MTEPKAALPKSARFLLQQDTLQALNYPIFRCCFFPRAWRLSTLLFQLRKGPRHRVLRAGRVAGPAAHGPRWQRCCEHTLPGQPRQDRDQDVPIESNRCKTQTQRSQTPKAPANIPSRETAEGSLCIQSAHKALFLFPLSAFETICILSKILLSLLLLCFWQPGCGRWRRVQLTAGSCTPRSQSRETPFLHANLCL